MAFTATITNIAPADDGNGNIQFLVTVNFADSASGWANCRVYAFPINTSQAIAVAKITNDGTGYKSSLAAISNLSSKIGTVITI